MRTRYVTCLIARSAGYDGAELCGSALGLRRGESCSSTNLIPQKIITKNKKKGLSDAVLRPPINLQYEVTIHTLPRLKCIRLVSMRSSRLPFKLH